ncbi:bifunctional methylenetetrahydrofolate dehydrogenase/methenyltetrahydrofolate cyclohydrolase FolD [Buchnera aphidicola (Mindarus keteleerifoliae)]|uniref:bifunctional methylenetetrahydrofolate dehydrogenase/methenyltetrahydrofolate cyclohydrolase FolD n=1 Tax=Buchnera aphidicola TaxID=9 RepID=UPI0031B71B35
MFAKIIDGKKIAQKIEFNILKKIKNFVKFGDKPPGLSIISVGNNPASSLYIKKKREACQRVGINFTHWKFSSKTQENQIIKLIKKLNEDPFTHGILIQFPIHEKLNSLKIISYISPKKDVDGLHPFNIGCLVQKNPTFRPCTPKGIITLLKKEKINLRSLHGVIIGASNIVGRPMSLELLLAGCTTTITHRFTKDLKTHTKTADLLIVAVGKPFFINKSWIKKGSIIIDVGINKLKNNKIVGDVDFLSAASKASYITPVPGGVGPMTIISLLENTVKAYLYEKNKKYLLFSPSCK